MALLSAERGERGERGERRTRQRRRWIRRAAGAAVVAAAGCAGMDRGCSSCTAESFGADWVVVQLDYLGRPYRCWTIRNTSIANEQHSDGIYWVDEHGNLVHISGVGSSRVDLQACKLEYSIVSPK